MESQDLRKVGLKVTHPRMRILGILELSDGRHMTAEDIYKELLSHDDDIGLATVYRVLTQFEAAGLVLLRAEGVTIRAGRVTRARSGRFARP